MGHFSILEPKNWKVAWQIFLPHESFTSQNIIQSICDGNFWAHQYLKHDKKLMWAADFYAVLIFLALEHLSSCIQEHPGTIQPYQ